MSHQLWKNLIKNSVSPNQLYFLDCCRHKIRPTSIINEEAERIIAQKRGYLDQDGNLTPDAVFILDEFESLLSKTKKMVASEVLGADSAKNIEEYRTIFPAKRVPRVGLLRQTPQELKDKFIWFFKTYPQFTWEDVLNGTDYYIHLKEQENWEYITTSSYFIQRTDNMTKTCRSLLADYAQLAKDKKENLTEV